MSGVVRRAAVWALAALCTLAPAAADGNIGCLYSSSLCATGVEWCYDDFAFGKCVQVYDSEPEESTLYRYNMSAEELKSFELVLQELLSLGYRWENAYTQCVLQAMLLSSRQHLKSVNMKVCEQFSDPDIISGNKQPDNKEEVDPEEQAYIRFTPNVSPVSDSDFANEVFAPPVEPEDASLYLPSRELSLLEGDNSNNDNEEFEEMIRESVDGMRIPHKDFSEDILPVIEEDEPDLMKIKKSYYPLEENIDDDEAYEEASRSLAKLRKLDVDIPYTTEYITANRFTPEEARVLSSTMERYRERFRQKEFPFEYEDETNDIPESRVYVDEDDEVDADVGSGQFDPVKLQMKDNQMTDAQISNMDYLLALWKNDVLSRKKPFNALFAEGGPIMERVTGENEHPLGDAGIPDPFSNYDWGFKRRERLDVKKPGPRLDWQALMFKYKKNLTESNEPHTTLSKKNTQIETSYSYDPSYVYVLFHDGSKTEWKRGIEIINKATGLLGLEKGDITHPRVDKGEVTFKVVNNSKKINASEAANKLGKVIPQLEEELDIKITAIGLGDKLKSAPVATADEPGFFEDRENILVMLAACGVVVAVAGAGLALLIRKDAQAKRKLAGLASAAEIDAEATQDYQELCRARMTGSKWSGQQTGVANTAVCGGDAVKVAILSKDQDHNASSARSSTSSWSEEPALTNMDISTGHMVLAYMEDHLKNKDRLEQEWAALCAYEAEPCATTAASADDNIKKNRNPDVLPYDHSRVVLNALTNHLGSDYINASTITDHDPRNPAYIAAQGPLAHTAADFWQLVWEQGSVVMVMLTRLAENGVEMCHRYWPEEASELYHIYEVHLVSEHIWCDDYLVRSFYLKNQRTGETRTVTQFHFLSWPEASVPASTKALLEFRRKVNKSYRGRSCPIVVHCSDGASRTGTYCLIDMVLNRMAKGAKEIDIAATLEHIRDQRPHMVTTKQQFEFVLMAVAEEVHAILKALPAQLQQHDKKDTDKDKPN